MTALKNCPFCGSPARVVLDYQDIERWAQCTKRKPESCVLSTAIIEIAKWNRRTQPEATKPAQDLGAAILAMNRAKLLPIWDNDVPHKLHVELDVIFKALSALASPADALVAGDRVDAELAKADQSPVPITNQELAAFHRFCDCCEDFDSGGHDVEKSMMSQLVRIGLVRPAGPGRHETTKFGDWLRDSAAIQTQKDGHG